jgi:hypothetical protein
MASPRSLTTPTESRHGSTASHWEEWSRGKFREHFALGRVELGEDPEAILVALLAALREGATPTDVARAVAFAAARIAHFGIRSSLFAREPT